MSRTHHNIITSCRIKIILAFRRIVQYIERDDNLIPARGVMLFTLAADPTYVQPHEPLHIFNTAGALRPAEIVLYVRRKL
jgi:hypothetical protein